MFFGFSGVFDVESTAKESDFGNRIIKISRKV
jgi:hypothetical protein